MLNLDRKNILLIVWKWLSEAQSFILTVVACIRTIPNDRRRRSLPYIGFELICIMTLVGIAFERIGNRPRLIRSSTRIMVFFALCVTSNRGRDLSNCTHQTNNRA